MTDPLSYRFLISAVVDKAAEILEVVCHSEDDAIGAAKMFAEDAVNVELWQGARRIWLNVH